MKSKSQLMVQSVAERPVASKACAGATASQTNKTLAESALSQSSTTVAGSTPSQKDLENVKKYMARTRDAFAHGLASASPDLERGTLAGRVRKG